MRNDKLIRTFFNEPWLLTERKLEQIEAFVISRLAGEAPAWAGPANEERETMFYALEGAEGGAGGGTVAVIPLYGVLTQRAGLMTQYSGGTSTEAFRRRFLELVNSPQVKTIVIDGDTPGGGVYGVDELATTIREATAKKPVIAVANSLIASAGYYAVSGASEIVVTPSGEIGSIGVLAVHYDYSKADEIVGITPTLIKAGKYKAEGLEDFPLSDDAAAHLQEDVDRYYEMFVAAVATGRGTTAQAVRNGYGEGRVVGAREAVRIGLADRVATLDQTVARFAAGGRPAKRGKAADVALTPLAAVLTSDPSVITLTIGPPPADPPEHEPPAPEPEPEADLGATLARIDRLRTA